MFWIAMELVDLIVNHRITLLVIVFLIGLIELTYAAYYWNKYVPYNREYRVPVSVVISVFREMPNIFKRCLESVNSQLKPEDEVLIVFDGKDDNLEKIAQGYGTTVVKVHGGKRSTLYYGCNMAKNSIILTLDSDTILCPNCLDEIIKPFADNKIGAVSGHQRILDANMNLTSKFADYCESIAHDYWQKATSSSGSVPILYGRCLAIRRDIWYKIKEKYISKKFLGKRIESGDDIDITQFTIIEGYKTFMQSTARITSDCPRTFWSRLKQQYRWNRSTSRVVITDWILEPRLFKASKFAFGTQLYATVFVPFLILGIWVEWILNVLNGRVELIVLSQFASVILSTLTLISVLGIRQLHMIEKTSDVPKWFVFILYYWLILGMVNLISILTFWLEKPSAVQYTRNK